MNPKDTSKHAIRDSICWHCSRSTDSSCSWSDRFMLVDGCSASYTKSRKTYMVMDCPLFAKYKCDLADDTGYRKMSDAVLARAGQDYLKLTRYEKKMREDDPALFTKRALYGNWRARNTEKTYYRKPLSDTWKTLYNFEPFDMEIVALERFFVSEYAELFNENVNPVYIMESIQRQVGIRHESI